MMSTRTPAGTNGVARSPVFLRRRFDRSPDLVDDLADLVLAHDERRGQFDRVAGRPYHDPRIEERVVERTTDTLARAALNGRKIDRAGETDAADVEDVGQPLEPHDRVIPLGLERLGALEQALVAIEVDRRQRRGASERMARRGIAVEELDGALRPLHEGVGDWL